MSQSMEQALIRFYTAGFFWPAMCEPNHEDFELIRSIEKAGMIKLGGSKTRLTEKGKAWLAGDGKRKYL